MELFINIIKSNKQGEQRTTPIEKKPASPSNSIPKEAKQSIGRDTVLCLAVGLLYGLSWPVFEGVNLSFLAWFSFVPLFIFLHRNQDRFWKSLVGSYLAMLVFGLMTAGWLFNFPQAKGQIAVVVLLEIAYFTFPVIPFFLLQRRLGFERALWLFPLLWTIWEWLYLDLDFTMGTHLSAYSQSGNLWLVQFIDLTGMWGIACWLLFFNVFLYKAYRAAGDRFLTKAFVRKAFWPTTLLLGLPLLYAVFAFNKYDEPKGEQLRVGLVPTYFTAAFFQQVGNSQVAVERSLHKTDSLFFTAKDRGAQPVDLYVWPETGTDFHLETGNVGELFNAATKDWDAALLTGCRSRPAADTTDWRDYVSGVMISPRSKAPAYHHKTVLTPGQEMIPYHRQLAQFSGFPIPLEHPRYRRQGILSQPLPLTTRDGREFQLGISLCFEQWYPTHWAALARNGADAYVHMAGEGWYGEVGFKQFMVNVSRLRCIENRRAAARCANVGISGFISATGRLSRHNTKQNQPQNLAATAGLTPFARWPNWFPAGCLLALVGGIAYSPIIRKRINHDTF
ncbi:MAG: apolipoprotein N-acyltransferase [Lewinella sp.]